jgi:hypothetical protein
MHRRARYVTLGVALAALASGATGGEPRLKNARLRSVRDNQLLEHALRGAERRLADARCQRVLDDFRDGAGHSLREVLDLAGRTAPQHLRELLFYDGAPDVCEGAHLAYTEVGSRVIFVCPNLLRDRAANRLWTESSIIHETLHSLGLAENPPTSAEIQRSVVDRCG